MHGHGPAGAMPRRTHRGRWQRSVLCGLAALLGALTARAEDVPEYRLKSAFLYNFAAYTEWPAEVGGTLNLCIYGADPFGAEVDPLNGKTVGVRTIDVHRKSSPDTLKGCQLVFVAASHIGQLPRVLDTVRGLPALVVADSPGATRQGAALNMNLAQGRVTFEANLAAARAVRLRLSANLLRLATEVIQ
jgi:YfiR/HmsC-like